MWPQEFRERNKAWIQQEQQQHLPAFKAQAVFKRCSLLSAAFPSAALLLWCELEMWQCPAHQTSSFITTSELCLPRNPGLRKSSHIKINKTLLGCYSAGHKSNWGDTDGTGNGKIWVILFKFSFLACLPSLCCSWCWKQLQKNQDLWMIFWLFTPNSPLSVAVSPHAPKRDHHNLWGKKSKK